MRRKRFLDFGQVTEREKALERFASMANNAMSGLTEVRDKSYKLREGEEAVVKIVAETGGYSVSEEIGKFFHVRWETEDSNECVVVVDKNQVEQGRIGGYWMEHEDYELVRMIKCVE